MPRNMELIDFKCIQPHPSDQEDWDANYHGRNEVNWGRPEIALTLIGGQGGMYDQWERRNGVPYYWMNMSREVAQNLHRALGAYLSKEARGA